jgi:hypothetical protein
VLYPTADSDRYFGDLGRPADTAPAGPATAVAVQLAVTRGIIWPRE